MQKFVLSFVVAAVLCAVLVAAEAFGGKAKGKEGEWGKMKCGEEEFKSKGGETIKKAVTDCLKESKQNKNGKAEEEERSRRSPDEDRQEKNDGCNKNKDKRKWNKKKGGRKHECFKACVLTKLGLLGSDGKWEGAGAKEYIGSTYPDKVGAAISEGWSACASNSTCTFSMKNNCAGCGPFAKCLKAVHEKNCGANTFPFGGFGGNVTLKGNKKAKYDNSEN